MPEATTRPRLSVATCDEPVAFWRRCISGLCALLAPATSARAPAVPFAPGGKVTVTLASSSLTRTTVTLTSR